jgi:hypothetical protein
VEFDDFDLIVVEPALRFATARSRLAAVRLRKPET